MGGGGGEVTGTPAVQLVSQVETAPWYKALCLGGLGGRVSVFVGNPDWHLESW